MSNRPFHLAFLVTGLEETRRFYRDVLGCPQGREAERWIDFDFFGHQISAHLIESNQSNFRRTAVDGDGVPIPHFGPFFLSMNGANCVIGLCRMAFRLTCRHWCALRGK